MRRPFFIVAAVVLSILAACASPTASKSDSYVANIQIISSPIENLPVVGSPTPSDASSTTYYAYVILYKNSDTPTDATSVIVDGTQINYNSQKRGYYTSLISQHKAGDSLGVSISYPGMTDVHATAIIPSVAGLPTSGYTLNGKSSSTYSYTVGDTITVAPPSSAYTGYGLLVETSGLAIASTQYWQSSTWSDRSGTWSAVATSSDLYLTISGLTYSPTTVRYSLWPENYYAADVSSTTSYVIRAYATAGVTIH